MKSKIRFAIWKRLAKLAFMLKVSIPPLPSTCVIIQKGNKILAIDLSYRSGLSLPGGGLEFNETFEEAAKREVWEETNLKVTNLKYLSSNKYENEGISHVSICFLGRVKDVSKMKSSDEGKLLWTTPQQLYKQACYPDVRKHIKGHFNLN